FFGIWHADGSSKDAVQVLSSRFATDTVAVDSSVNIHIESGGTAVFQLPDIAPYGKTLFARSGGQWGGRGINVAKLDATGTRLIQYGSFDFWAPTRRAGEYKRFQAWLAALDQGDVIVASVADEAGIAARNPNAVGPADELAEQIVMQFENLGSTWLRNIGYQQPWAGVFRIGDNTAVAESLGAKGEPLLLDATAHITPDPDATRRPGIRILESNGDTRILEGGSDAISISLNSRPTQSVVVTISPPEWATADVSSLTFTEANWNQPQDVRIHAGDDGIRSAELIDKAFISVDRLLSDAAYGDVSDTFVWATRIDRAIGVPTPRLNPDLSVSWEAIDGATGFEVWFADLTGSTVSHPTTTSLTFAPGDIQPGQYRFWVRSIGGDGQLSDWSTPVSFLKDYQPVVAPMQRRIATTSVDLTWRDAPARVTSHEIYVARRPPGKAWEVLPLMSSQKSTVNIDNLVFATYRVWVRAVLSDGTRLSWSSMIEFQSVASPIIAKGAASTFSRQPLLSWTAVGGASGYRIQARNDATREVVITETTATQWWPTNALAWNTPYRFFVKAISTNLETDWSEPRSIYIGGRPILNSPSGLVTAPILFSWSEVAGATAYEIEIDAVSGSNSRRVLLATTASPTFQPSVQLTPGKYRWWVRTLREGSPSVWSNPLDFTV
ncbi:MAG: hypothetical protein KDA96_23020, partial [Planctomycetaceae bacterium]|nr:hypothetical protein [Planctomycetaceae bacterium]